ncbi:MAG: hypothetical protein ACI977_000432 [Candidatus Nanohaloarchaea archaeon]|jgi:hypothetical protein
MVRRKGLSYSLEVIISAIIILSFTYGIFEIPQGNDWNQHRSEIEAQDLTQTLHKTGLATSLVSRGETGSLQTAITTISDRDRTISGSITNIPIGEVEVGYHTVDEDQYTVNLEDVQGSGDMCQGDLQDDIDTQKDIKRTQQLGTSDENYDVRLYIADTGSQFDESVDYNTVWVDNGTECQFTASDGPFFLEDNFKWGDSNNSAPSDHFQIKSIEGNQLTIYKTTIPTQIHKQMNEPVNSLRPEVEMDAIDIRDEELTQDIMVFRKTEALDDIDTERTKVEDYMQDYPVLMMMDINQADFSNSDFMQNTNFHWVDAGFSGGYGGNPTSIEFTNSDISRNIETFFEGMNGDSASAALPPAGPIVSNNSDTLTQENPALQGGATLNTAAWSDRVDNMATTPYDGEPSPDCGTRYEGTVNLPGGNYPILNTELVGSEGSCPTDGWAVNFDFQGSADTGRGPFLQGEETIIDRRGYTILTNSDDSGCDLGECVEFNFSGNSNVEVINYGESFQGFDGERLALTGRKTSYNEEEFKLLSSTIFSLYDSEVTFGTQQSSSISTDIVSGVDNTTYMPYQLRLRWSR